MPLAGLGGRGFLIPRAESTTGSFLPPLTKTVFVFLFRTQLS